MSKYRTHTCNELTRKNKNQKVYLSGWINKKRDHGNLLFLDLRDNYGLTQCVIDKDSKEALVLDQAIGSRIDEESIKLGLIIRPLYHICVLSPALIITKEQINELTEKLYQAISNTIDQLKNEGLWSHHK